LERRSVPRSVPTSEELESRFSALKRHLAARQVQLAKREKSVSSEEEPSVERPVAVKVLGRDPMSGPEGLPQKAKNNSSGPTDLSQAAGSTSNTSCKEKEKGLTIVKKVGQGARKRRRLAASSA
jgi:hypothetical protein